MVSAGGSGYAQSMHIAASAARNCEMRNKATVHEHAWLELAQACVDGILLASYYLLLTDQ